MSGSKTKTIKVDGRVYAKTLQFGNRNQKTVFKNKKAYSRKGYKVDLSAI